LCQKICPYISHVTEKYFTRLYMTFCVYCVMIYHYVGRYEYDDRKYIELVTKIDRFFATNVLGFMENFFPAINWFPTLRDLIRSRSVSIRFLSSILSIVKIGIISQQYPITMDCHPFIYIIYIPRPGPV